MREAGPLSRTTPFDLLQATAGEDRAPQAGAFNVPRRISMIVAVFNEQPAFLLTGTSRALSCPDQREATAQLCAVERHVDFAAGKLLARRDAVLRLVSARVPHHHPSRSIFPLRDHPPALRIFQRMILRAYG